MYSLGVTLFILLMGYSPFQGETATELHRQTVSDRIEDIEYDWSAVSSDAMIVVKNMLGKNSD